MSLKQAVQRVFRHQNVARLNQKRSTSPESLCLSIVSPVQQLNLLENLEAIFYWHLVVQKQRANRFQNFELGWLIDHRVDSIDYLQPVPVGLSFYLEIQSHYLFLNCLQITFAAAGHNHQFIPDKLGQLLRCCKGLLKIKLLLRCLTSQLFF